MTAARPLRWKTHVAPLAILALLTSAPMARAAVSTSHLASEEEALTLIEANGGGFRFSAETTLKGHPLGDLTFRPGATPELEEPVVATALTDWRNNQVVPFTLTFDGVSQATLSVTYRSRTTTVTNLPDFVIAPDLNELFLRTQALVSGGSATVSNLVLNGVAVTGTSSAVAGTSGAIDILRIQGGSLAGGFTLTGSISMAWPGLNRPSQTLLSLQIWGAKVIEDTTPPVVSITAPANGSFLPTATPTITASYSDALSGLDLASVRLLVDGVDRTAGAAVTGSGLTFTPAAGLAEGAHRVEVVVRDLAGNERRATVELTTDTVRPMLDFLAPTGPRFIGDPTPTLSLVYSDESSGLNLATLQVAVDEVSLNSSCTVSPASAACETPPLADGAHTATATVSDLAGNSVAEVFDFEVVLDLLPPSIYATTPEDQSLVSSPQVPVAGTVTDDGLVESVQVNGVEVAAPEGHFETVVTLLEGLNEIAITATDAGGRQGLAVRRVTLDSSPPRIDLEAPQSGQVTNQGEISVRGEVVDESGLESLTLQQEPLVVTGGRFEATVPVAPGVNAIALRAVDRAGNEAVRNLSVTRMDVPVVEITSPPDLSFLAATTVDVSGSVSPGNASVSVNGVAATVAGSVFVATDVPLIEGGNIVTATATSAEGNAGTATINVVRDLTPPILAIHYPAAGATFFDSTITVSGMVNDIVAGTVNDSEAQVTVNGSPAAVANRSFVVDAVTLAPGENKLLVEATDLSGNIGRENLTVFREVAAPARIRIESGDHQEAVVGTTLPQPLVVSLLDGAGQPLAGTLVHFKVQGSSGTLDGGERQRVVASDSAGRASVHFTLGSRAGVGNQVVEAASSGLAGTAVFHSSARPGEAAHLVVDSGDQQLGTSGQPLPRPLVAVVTDTGYNRLEGAGVRFRVVRGEGLFANGLPEIVAISDSDGRVIVPFTIGVEEGVANNVVESTLQGQEGGPVAAFVSSGRAAGDPGETAVSGVVLDNSNQPVAGVTIRILDNPLHAQTDLHGLFRIVGVPVGTIKLIVDGTTAERPGTWPTLEFVIPTVVGQDNTVNMPIYLLPLDQSSGLVIDETHGGTLTLPEVPGFALRVLPGSVTFPTGSRSGVVSVTVVHSDKVPMVPNFGQQPRFIVTIQPAGARFDPPARLTLPNLEGLAPGAVTEMYSFDHDLGHFVSIGPATVSEDGATILADPGVGVIKAGWHCGGNPAVVGVIHKCPECKVCEGTICVADPFADHRPCGSDHCHECVAGRCGERGSDVEIVAPKNQPLIRESHFELSYSFLSNSRIQAIGRVLPNADPDKIEWRVIPYRGSIKDEAPPDYKGQIFEFTPDPPPHPPYVVGTRCPDLPGNGSCVRSKPLSYEIRAKFCRAYDSIRITQDIVDIIRQEYLNHRLLGIQIPVPDRLGFRVPENTANFNASAVLNTAYPVVLGRPEHLAQAIYDEFNRRIHDDVQAVPVGTSGLSPGDVVVGPGATVPELGALLDTRPCNGANSPQTCDDLRVGNTIVAGPDGVADTVALAEVTDVPLRINSTWRNPERNEAVGGVDDSRHQFGDAVDLKMIGSITGKTWNQLYCILVAAAQDIVNDTDEAFAEHFAHPRACTAGDISHVHAER